MGEKDTDLDKDAQDADHYTSPDERVRIAMPRSKTVQPRRSNSGPPVLTTPSATPLG
jgi:hypothetical protein